ncbi:MAG: hypothetical protein JETCAE03_33330 [Ignavibacteriaceae bacterium]|jgi:hypothetical protein|nr:MAG: hypothetical protein JETCAE03_33330 [Ignavibacteriaceae bacterium]
MKKSELRQIIKEELLKEMHLTNVLYDQTVKALNKDGSYLHDLITTVRTLISELEDYNFKDIEIKEFILLYLDRNLNAGIKFR